MDNKNIGLSECPGCGVNLPDLGLRKSERFNASGECWEMFMKLSGYIAQGYDEEFIQQMSIDTYEAQHAGGTTKNIAGAFGLIGLYLSLEKGFSGKEVQRAHMDLANRSKEWPRFGPSPSKWKMTVKNVVDAGPKKSKKMIHLWAKATWKEWEFEKERIIGLMNKVSPGLEKYIKNGKKGAT